MKNMILCVGKHSIVGDGGGHTSSVIFPKHNLTKYTMVCNVFDYLN